MELSGEEGVVSEVLAYIALGAVLLAEGMALGYGDAKFPPRPTPYRIVSLVAEVALVWLCIRTVI